MDDINQHSIFHLNLNLNKYQTITIYNLLFFLIKSHQILILFLFLFFYLIYHLNKNLSLHNLNLNNGHIMCYR
jgi:hypothetical protein